jgi:hypothetical protein
MAAAPPLAAGRLPPGIRFTGGEALRRPLRPPRVEQRREPPAGAAVQQHAVCAGVEAVGDAPRAMVGVPHRRAGNNPLLQVELAQPAQVVELATRLLVPLLRALLRETFEARLLPQAEPDASGAEQVLAQIDNLRRELRRDPAALRAFMVLSFEAATPIPELREWIVDWVGRYENQTVAELRAAQRDGSVRPDLDPTREARRFISTGIGHAFRWTIAPETFDYDAALRDWRAETESRWCADRSTRAR